MKLAELAARVGFMGGHGVSVSQLSAVGLLAERTPPLIMGGAQPLGYVHVGQNQGLNIWGHSDIVQASITNARRGGSGFVSAHHGSAGTGTAHLLPGSSDLAC